MQAARFDGVRISRERSCFDCQKFFDCPKPIEIWKETNEKIPFGMHERFIEREKGLKKVYETCQERVLW